MDYRCGKLKPITLAWRSLRCWTCRPTPQDHLRMKKITHRDDTCKQEIESEKRSNDGETSFQFQNAPQRGPLSSCSSLAHWRHSCLGVGNVWLKAYASDTGKEEHKRRKKMAKFKRMVKATTLAITKMFYGLAFHVVSLVHTRSPGIIEG